MILAKPAEALAKAGSQLQLSIIKGRLPKNITRMSATKWPGQQKTSSSAPEAMQTCYRRRIVTSFRASQWPYLQAQSFQPNRAHAPHGVSRLAEYSFIWFDFHIVS
jgi:hypothetical protein